MGLGHHDKPSPAGRSAELHCHVRVPSESGVGWAAAELQCASPRMTMGGWRPGRPASGGGASLAGAGSGRLFRCFRAPRFVFQDRGWHQCGGY